MLIKDWQKIIKTGITCNEWLATFQFSTILYKFRISNFFPSFPFCLGRQRSDPAHDLCTEAKGSSSQALGRSCSKGVFGILPSLAGGGGGWDEHTPNAYEGLLHWYLPPTDTCRNSISSAFVFVFAAALCSRVLLRVFFSNSLRLSSQRTKDRLLSEWVYHMTRCSETHLGGSGLCTTFDLLIHWHPFDLQWVQLRILGYVTRTPGCKREREWVEWESHTLGWLLMWRCPRRRCRR